MDAAIATRPGARSPGRLQTILVLVVTAVLIGGAAWFIDTQTAPSGFTEIEIAGAATAVRVGDVAPVFSATTIDGTEVSLADYAGRPVWLTFGASWCADCRAEAPDIQAAWERYGSEGLLVLSIAIQEDAPTAKTYAERAGLTFPTVADPRTEIARRFGLFGTPTHYFIGRDGRVEEIRLGGLQPEDMDTLIASVMD
jgi:cytochrome c biogenesis protein CcmG, thiol:disulfide interchange protein DsbE